MYSAYIFQRENDKMIEYVRKDEADKVIVDLQKDLLETRSKLRELLTGLECQKIEDLLAKPAEYFAAFGQAILRGAKLRLKGNKHD